MAARLFMVQTCLTIFQSLRWMLSLVRCGQSHPMSISPLSSLETLDGRISWWTSDVDCDVCSSSSWIFASSWWTLSVTCWLWACKTSTGLLGCICTSDCIPTMYVFFSCPERCFCVFGNASWIALWGIRLEINSDGNCAIDLSWTSENLTLLASGPSLVFRNKSVSAIVSSYDLVIPCFFQLLFLTDSHVKCAFFYTRSMLTMFADSHVPFINHLTLM